METGTTLRESSPDRLAGGRNGHGKPTISSVAKRAGVSVATVSYVLNGRTTEVSRETAERVMAAVQELGYVKNLAAAALSGQKTRLVAVIIPGIESIAEGGDLNPFYGEFIFRLEHQARLRGYGLCVHGGGQRDTVNFLLQRGAETAVLVGAPDWELPAVLMENDIRCVLYDSFSEDARHSQVRTDEIRGGCLAAERLIDIRKRRLVFVGALRHDHAVDVVAMRLRGAIKACEMAEIEPIRHLEAEVSYEGGVAAAQQVVESGADGVVASADILAAGLMEGLQQRGVRIPHDIAVIGYDNLPICRFLRPRLSTIDQGLTDKVRAVMSMIESREQGLIKIISPNVVVRESA